MASKVLVPAAPFAKLQLKKSPPEATASGFFITSDEAARVAHLEHSVRFLQEQHRLMLSGLHGEIQSLRERNRDLQFQLIFNKGTAPKTYYSAKEDTAESGEESHLRAEVCRLEREAAAARGEARAAEARALQLQRVLDVQNERVRTLESRAACASCAGAGGADATGARAEGTGSESRGELRARLADAERLVRRLRADAERQRREVHGGASAAGGAVTNLLFDGAAATHAHLQCMKTSLQASLHAGGALDNFGYQNTYHFPAMHDFWTESLREEAPRGARRRPLALPDLAPYRATIFANAHARGRSYGYEKSKKQHSTTNGDAPSGKAPEESQNVSRLKELRNENLAKANHRSRAHSMATYPELKIVVTKMIPHGKVCVNGGATAAASAATSAAVSGGASSVANAAGESRSRQRRHHHRKHTTDHT